MNEKVVDFIIFTVMAIALLLIGEISKRYFLVIFGVVMAVLAVIAMLDLILAVKISINAKKKRREKRYGSIHK